MFLYSSSENLILCSCGWDWPALNKKRRAKCLLLRHSSLCRTAGSCRCPLAATALKAERLNGHTGETSRESVWLTRITRGSVQINNFFFGVDMRLFRTSRRNRLCSELQCFETFGIFSDQRCVFRDIKHWWNTSLVLPHCQAKYCFAVIAGVLNIIYYPFILSYDKWNYVLQNFKLPVNINNYNNNNSVKICMTIT